MTDTVANPPSEPKKVKVNFNYSLTEYIAAYHFHYSHLPRLQIVLLIAVLFLLTGIGLCLLLGYSLLNSLPIYISVLLVCMLVFEYFLTPTKNYKGDSRLKEHYSIVFSKDKILFNQSNSTVALNWKQYFKYTENSDFFLLYYGPETFLIIPKRTMSEEEAGQLKELLSINIK